MKSIFDQMVSRYEIKTQADLHNARHEVLQEITLSAFNRTDFFQRAAFYGGTCLRIFHGIDRFSEDMDFSLMQKDELFNIEHYFEAIENEFNAFGREIEVTRKSKKQGQQVESAFLKDNTDILNVEFRTERAIKIKIEVDKDPPLKFDTEFKLLLMPFSFMTRCFTIPGLFAGKMHALLFRNWRNRVKGRDWYDLEWYVRNGHPVDFPHLKERALQSGYREKEKFTVEKCMEILNSRIANTNIEAVKADVFPFIRNPEALDIWSTEYFLQLAGMIKFNDQEPV